MSSALVKTTGREAWAKLPEESDSDYLHFLAWLRAETRPALQGDVAKVALRYDWCERANQHDVADALAQKPGVKMKSAVGAMVGTLMLEANKLLQRSSSAGAESVLSPKEIILLAGLMASLQDKFAARDHDPSDEAAQMEAMKSMSDDEFELVEQASAVMERNRRKS